MKRIFGVVMLVTGAAAITGLGMLASRLAADDHTTEVRALVVHGALVSSPVRITDLELASTLYDEVHRVQQHAPLYPKELLMRRPCLTMVAFLPKSGSAESGLSPQQGDASWYFYPAVDYEPAVLGRARISRDQLRALSGYGIPARVSRDAGAACAAQPNAPSSQGQTP
jgi:hypothetical protein